MNFLRSQLIMMRAERGCSTAPCLSAAKLHRRLQIEEASCCWVAGHGFQSALIIVSPCANLSTRTTYRAQIRSTNDRPVYMLVSKRARLQTQRLSLSRKRQDDTHAETSSDVGH